MNCFEKSDYVIIKILGVFVDMLYEPLAYLLEKLFGIEL